jgi:hypothetical protein
MFKRHRTTFILVILFLTVLSICHLVSRHYHQQELLSRQQQINYEMSLIQDSLRSDQLKEHPYETYSDVVKNQVILNKRLDILTKEFDSLTNEIKNH